MLYHLGENGRKPSKLLNTILSNLGGEFIDDFVQERNYFLIMIPKDKMLNDSFSLIVEKALSKKLDLPHKYEIIEALSLIAALLCSAEIKNFHFSFTINQYSIDGKKEEDLCISLDDESFRPYIGQLIRHLSKKRVLNLCSDDANIAYKNFSSEQMDEFNRMGGHSFYLLPRDWKLIELFKNLLTVCLEENSVEIKGALKFISTILANYDLELPIVELVFKGVVLLGYNNI